MEKAELEKIEQLMNKNQIYLTLLSKPEIESLDEKILFIAAMREEMESMKECLEAENIKFEEDENFKGYRCPIFKFNYKGAVCYLTYVGISYFSAPFVCHILEDIAPDSVINIGTCASLIGESFGSMVVSNNCYCNDLDLTRFGYKDGTNRKGLIKSYGPVIVSGSQFLEGDDKIEQVRKRFRGAVAFDMETFMFHEICSFYSVKFLSVRAVSDSGSSDEFSVNVKSAAYISASCALLAVRVGVLDELVKY